MYYTNPAKSPVLRSMVGQTKPYFVPTPASFSVSQPRLGRPFPLDPPPATPEPRDSGLAEAYDSFRAFAAR